MKKTIEEIRTMTTDEIRNRIHELNALGICNEEYKNLDFVLDERYVQEAEENGYWEHLFDM